MPILPSRKSSGREFVTIRKQTRRGRFFEVGRCIITFECGHKREYGTSDAPSKYRRCVECGKMVNGEVKWKRSRFANLRVVFRLA